MLKEEATIVVALDSVICRSFDQEFLDAIMETHEQASHDSLCKLRLIIGHVMPNRNSGFQSQRYMVAIQPSVEASVFR